MTEQSTSSSEKDWGNLRFTQRGGGYSQGSPEDNANSWFVIGLVVFVLVALLYAWYSYWVQARLVERDVTRAVEVMDAQLRSELKAVEMRARQGEQPRHITDETRRRPTT